MSQRSIVEINHDFSHTVRREPENFCELLQRALASGSNESWEPLRRFGIRRIVQLHHSTDRKVVAHIGCHDVEYPIP